MRFEMNYRQKKCKKYKHMEATQYTTKQTRHQWRNQRESGKISRNKWQWKHNDPKPVGWSKSSSKREVYSNTVLPQETRKISNKPPNLIHKELKGFPGGAMVESLPANAGDTGSSPGLGRSHVPRSSWAHEPQLLSLRVWSLCSTTREAATVRGPRTVMKSGPRLPQLEKALAQKRRPNTAINK